MPKCDPFDVLASLLKNREEIARDENSSQLVNFPYAITAFATLGTGLLAMSCGIVATSVWLAAVGFILTLVGGGMYGWSLYDG
jgi:hypothetical protein